MEQKKIIKLALAGNPNSGKTTIFNAMTGSHQKVGNYAGVTVEKKEGRISFGGYDFIIYDLPGIYSLTAYSMDEVITRDFIMKEKPDIIVDVIDSTNIERNLYLLLQLLELEAPLIGALNIVDQAETMGISIDEKEMSSIIGIPFVKTVGTKGSGIEHLLAAVINAYKAGYSERKEVSYGDELEGEVVKLCSALSSDKSFADAFPLRWFAVKLIEKDSHAMKMISGHSAGAKIESSLAASIRFIEAHYGRDSEIVVSEQRYGFIRGIIEECVTRKPDMKSISEKIDRFLLNRIIGLPIFLMVLWGIFKMTFVLSEYPSGWLETFFGWLSSLLSSVIPAGVVQSLVVDGIIGGVGGVLSFVPLVIILFAFISFLEDTGYMARAAFIMDKFLHLFGLHGQSFVPMMIGFGCSVPAVMSARTLKNRKDRIITVLVTPFMTCGAKLPVHVLLAGAFFPENASSMVMLIYLIGVALALISSWLFRKTVLRGDATPFVMELPPYRMPTGVGVVWHVWSRTKQYFRKAGTILLPASILIWAITSYPKPVFNEVEFEGAGQRYAAEHVDRNSVRTEISDLVSGKTDISKIENADEQKSLEEEKQSIVSGQLTIETAVDNRIKKDIDDHLSIVRKEQELEFSVAGRIGHFMQPVLSPMGFDWKIGISAITGFAAKEVVVSTLGILYKVGNEENEESSSLREAIRTDPSFSPLIAFVLMLFTVIIAPCFAALAVIRAEIGWKWLGFSVLYTTALAYALCTAVYQIGSVFL